MSDTDSTGHIVPAFRFAPNVKRRVDQIRLYIDLAGLLCVRLFVPLVQNAVWHSVLSIYNIAAWVTVLAVDSSRLPEATTTRKMQRKSWRYALRWTPALAMLAMVLVVGYRQEIMPNVLSIGIIVSLIIGSYFDELLFRNVLQPKLRRFGLPKAAAIGIQSSLYACAVWFGHPSLPVVLSFWVLGFINGLIVYRFRSLWPAFLLGFVWNVLWFA